MQRGKGIIRDLLVAALGSRARQEGSICPSFGKTQISSPHPRQLSRSQTVRSKTPFLDGVARSGVLGS